MASFHRPRSATLTAFPDRRSGLRASAAGAGWRSGRAASGIGPAARGSTGAVVASLRRGREAIVEIDGQLGEVLDWLGDPRKTLARDLADRLRSTTHRAAEALGSLGGPAVSELF